MVVEYSMLQEDIPIWKRDKGMLRFEQSEDSSSLTALFFKTSHMLHRRLGCRTSQHEVLRILAENGELSQAEMKEKLGVQAGSLSELLSKLEKRGKIIRSRAPEDRRKVLLSLTAAGQQDVRSPEIPEDERLFKDLTPEERLELQRILSKLLDAHCCRKETNVLQ